MPGTRTRPSRPWLRAWHEDTSVRAGGGFRPRAPGTLAPMTTIELTDDELRLLREAVRAYLDDFGHEEADVLRAIKRLLAKLQPASA